MALHAASRAIVTSGAWPCTVSAFESTGHTVSPCRAVVNDAMDAVGTCRAGHLIIASGLGLADSVVAREREDGCGCAFWTENRVRLHYFYPLHVRVGSDVRAREVYLACVAISEGINEPRVVSYAVEYAGIGAVGGSEHAALEFIGGGGGLWAVVTRRAKAGARALAQTSLEAIPPCGTAIHL